MLESITSGWPTIRKSSPIERRYSACARRQLSTQSCRRKYLDLAVEAKQQARCVLHALDPPVVGAFRNGVGTFSANDTLNGRPIVVRYIWSDITRTSAKWQQAFSDDGGKTWETNWIMEFHRLLPAQP
jgi:hypothetical protein